MRKDDNQNVKECTPCQDSGENLEYLITKRRSRILAVLTQPRQELLIEFNRNLQKQTEKHAF